MTTYQVPKVPIIQEKEFYRDRLFVNLYPNRSLALGKAFKGTMTHRVKSIVYCRRHGYWRITWLCNCYTRKWTLFKEVDADHFFCVGCEREAKRRKYPALAELLGVTANLEVSHCRPGSSLRIGE